MQAIPPEAWAVIAAAVALLAAVTLHQVKARRDGGWPEQGGWG